MEKTIITFASILTAGFLIGLVALAAAIGNSRACAAAIESTCKCPKQRTIILGPLLISVGLIESIPIIGAVLALVLLFANPFLQ